MNSPTFRCFGETDLVQLAVSIRAFGWTTRQLEKNMPGRIGVSGGETPMRVILRDSAYLGLPALVGVAHHHPLAVG
jgi:hypothetical protein